MLYSSGAAPSAAILRMRSQGLTDKTLEEQAELQTARQHITAVRAALVKDTSTGEAQHDELLSVQMQFAELESQLAPLLKQVGEQVRAQVMARRKLARLRRRAVLLRGMLALKTLVGDTLMAPFGTSIHHHCVLHSPLAIAIARTCGES